MLSFLPQWSVNKNNSLSISATLYPLLCETFFHQNSAAVQAAADFGYVPAGLVGTFLWLCGSCSYSFRGVALALSSWPQRPRLQFSSLCHLLFRRNVASAWIRRVSVGWSNTLFCQQLSPLASSSYPSFLCYLIDYIGIFWFWAFCWMVLRLIQPRLSQLTRQYKCSV